MTCLTNANRGLVSEFRGKLLHGWIQQLPKGPGGEGATGATGCPGRCPGIRGGATYLPLLPAGESTPDTLKGCRSRCPGGVSTRTPPRTARAGAAGADRCPGRVRRRGGHLGARREGGKRRAPASAGFAPNLWGRAPQPTPHASHGGAAPPWGASAPFTRRPHWRRTTAIPPSKRMGVYRKGKPENPLAETTASPPLTRGKKQRGFPIWR